MELLQPRIIGVRHDGHPSETVAVMKAINGLPEKSVIALELLPSELKRFEDEFYGLQRVAPNAWKPLDFFRRVVFHALWKGHEVKSIESTTDNRAPGRQRDLLHSPQGVHLAQYLRSKTFFNRIEKLRPALAVMGSLHADDIKRTGQTVEIMNRPEIFRHLKEYRQERLQMLKDGDAKTRFRLARIASDMKSTQMELAGLHRVGSSTLEVVVRKYIESSRGMH